MIVSNVQTRIALPSDLPAVLGMVHGLAHHHDDESTLTLEALEIEAREWVRQLQFVKRGMDLHHLYVAKQMRGIGVGRTLIEAAMDLSRDLGCTTLTVGTHPENFVAQDIYLASGFERVTQTGPRFKIPLDGQMV